MKCLGLVHIIIISLGLVMILLVGTLVEAFRRPHHPRPRRCPPTGVLIPKVIHQTYKPAFRELDPRLQRNVHHLQAVNPDWEYKYYSDADCVPYIQTHYGSRMVSTYRRINPKYGAARADLFRYLLMYQEGGIYLDIKSSATRPFSEILDPSDEFILTRWPKLRIPYVGNVWKTHRIDGEWIQWVIICRPKHPVWKHIIHDVLANFDKPEFTNAVGSAVCDITGPITYTNTIESHRHRYSFTDRGDYRDFLGLVYDNLPVDHSKALKHHYTTLTEPILLRV